MNIEKIYEKYDGLCAYCGQRITIEEVKVDQMQSESIEFDNLMPICGDCSNYKKYNDLESFREIIKNLHQSLQPNDIVKIMKNYGMIKIHPFNGKFLFERY
jgi:hypothetical protein